MNVPLATLGLIIKHVEVDPRYFRPAEVELLLGDPSKAKKILNWEPKTKFEELVKLMVDSDLEDLKSKIDGKKKENLKLHSLSLR